MASFDSDGRAAGLLLALSDRDDDEPYELYEMMFKETFPDPLCTRPKVIGYVEEVVGYVEDEISMCSSIFVSATQGIGTLTLRHCVIKMRALQRQPMGTHRVEAEIVLLAGLLDVCMDGWML